MAAEDAARTTWAPWPHNHSKSGLSTAARLPVLSSCEVHQVDGCALGLQISLFNSLNYRFIAWEFAALARYGIAKSRCYGPHQDGRITEIPEARDDTHGRMPRPDARLPTSHRPDAGVERHLSFLLLTTF